MKKIIIMLTAFLAVSWASAQTNPTPVTKKQVVDTISVTKTKQSTTTNPDGTKKVEKTYQGMTKPNTNATKNNTTGSPDYPKKPTDTVTTPGTVNPSRTKPGTVTNPDGTPTIPPRQ